MTQFKKLLENPVVQMALKRSLIVAFVLAALCVAVFFLNILGGISLDPEKFSKRIKDKFPNGDVSVSGASAAMGSKMTVVVKGVSLRVPASSVDGLQLPSAEISLGGLRMRKPFFSFLNPYSFSWKDVELRSPELVVDRSDLHLPELSRKFIDLAVSKKGLSPSSPRFSIRNGSVLLASGAADKSDGVKNNVVLSNLNLDAKLRGKEISVYATFLKDGEICSLDYRRKKGGPVAKFTLSARNVFSYIVRHNTSSNSGSFQLSIFDPLKFTTLHFGNIISKPFKRKIFNSIDINLQYSYDPASKKVTFQNQSLNLFGNQVSEFLIEHSSSRNINVKVVADNISAEVTKVIVSAAKASPKPGSLTELGDDDNKDKSLVSDSAPTSPLPLINFLPQGQVSRVLLDIDIKNFKLLTVADFKHIETNIEASRDKIFTKGTVRKDDGLIEYSGLVEGVGDPRKRLGVFSVAVENRANAFFSLINLPKGFRLETVAKPNYKSENGRIKGSFWLITGSDFLVLDNLKFSSASDTSVSGRSAFMPKRKAFDISFFNFNLNNFGIDIPEWLQKKSELFKSVYRSTNKQNYSVSISCSHCHEGGRVFDMARIAYKVNRGSFLLHDLSLSGSGIKMYASGLVSISAKQPTLDLSVNISEWDGMPLYLNGLLKGDGHVVLPSLAGFSGSVILSGGEINLGRYSISRAGLAATLKNGFLTIQSSSFVGKRSSTNSTNGSDGKLSAIETLATSGAPVAKYGDYKKILAGFASDARDITGALDGYVDFSTLNHKYNLAFATNGLEVADVLSYATSYHYNPLTLTGIIGISGSLNSAGSDMKSLRKSLNMTLKVEGKEVRLANMDLNSIGKLFSTTGNKKFLRLTGKKINYMISGGKQNIYKFDSVMSLKNIGLSVSSANFVGDYAAISFVGESLYYNRNNYNWKLAGRSTISAIDLAKKDKAAIGYIYTGSAYAGSSTKKELTANVDNAQLYKYAEMRKVIGE